MRVEMKQIKKLKKAEKKKKFRIVSNWLRHKAELRRKAEAMEIEKFRKDDTGD